MFATTAGHEDVPMTHKLSRRAVIYGFFAIFSTLLVALVLFRWRIVTQMLSRPSGPAREPVQPAALASTGSGLAQAKERPRVVVLTGGTPEQLVEQCLERLRAAETLAVKGKKVLVKPNVVSGTPAPTTTSAEVVRAVCAWLKKQGAATVWVGDMSAVMTMGTSRSMKDSGIEAAARQAGATPVYFEEHAWVNVKLPGARYIKEVPISEFVANADLVINLPVIKSHRWATYSVCLKNFVGATHGRYRPYMVDSDHWEEVIAELNLAYRPALNLADGTKVMYSGGPWRGDEAPLGLVVAGYDRVACDAVAVALMKTFAKTHERIADRGVWQQRQLRHAREIGLSTAGPDSLDLSVEHLEPPPPALHARLNEMRKLLQA